MRYIFLTGGFVGLISVAVPGFFADRPLDLILRDAAVGALAGGMLFRWFWTIFVKLLTHAVRAKRTAQAAAAAAAASAAKAAANAAAAAALKPR